MVPRDLKAVCAPEIGTNGLEKKPKSAPDVQERKVSCIASVGKIVEELLPARLSIRAALCLVGRLRWIGPVPFPIEGQGTRGIR